MKTFPKLIQKQIPKHKLKKDKIPNQISIVIFICDKLAVKFMGCNFFFPTPTVEDVSANYIHIKYFYSGVVQSHFYPNHD